jgi:hypothetical protein
MICGSRYRPLLLDAKFILISGLTSASGLTIDGLPAGWKYSLTDGTLLLDKDAPTPEPSTAVLFGGALVALGCVLRRRRRA